MSSTNKSLCEVKELIYVQEEKNATKQAIYIKVISVLINWQRHKWNNPQITFSMTYLPKIFSLLILLKNTPSMEIQQFLVCIVNSCWLDSPGMESQWWRDFPHLSSWTLWPTLPPTQCAPSILRRQNDWGLALTTEPHLGPSLKKE